MSPIAFCTLQILTTLVTCVCQTSSGFNLHRNIYSDMRSYQNLSDNSQLSVISPVIVANLLFATTAFKSLPKRLRVGIVTPQKHEKIINILSRKHHTFSDEEGSSDSYISLPTKFRTPSARAEDSLDIFTDVSWRHAKESSFTRFPAVQTENSNMFRGDFVTSSVTNEEMLKVIPYVPLRELLKYSFTESLVSETKKTTSTKVIELFKTKSIWQETSTAKTNPDRRRLCICDPYTLQKSPRPIYHINKSIHRHRLPYSLYDKLIEKVKTYSHDREITSTTLTKHFNLEDKIISKPSSKNMQKVWPTLKRHERENYDNYIKTTPILSSQNDKVKFFEIYDSDTDPPHKYTRDTTYNYKINNTEPLGHGKTEFTKSELENITTIQLSEKEISKMMLEYKNIDLGSYNKRYVGKEIIGKAPLTNNRTPANILNNRPIMRKMKLAKKETITVRSLSYDPGNYSTTIQDFLWSKYPFAAVYVDDRFQVHCDAAAVNSFWLLAAASCLSRHHHQPLSTNRPAYVAYCGDSWWNPERISYVKFIKIHPRFNVNDAVRRHIYNVGVIRVLTSMKTSCPNWSPVNIMSYQYDIGPDHAISTAVGWGLDRYDSSYTSRNLPRRVLSKYEGRLYTSSCPGNTGYRITRQLSSEAAENVYCLALPPYIGESTDPVHGALLLVEENLIALYLQEERRKLGNQCAQYTAIRKLLPWVLETANEPKEFQFFE